MYRILRERLDRLSREGFRGIIAGGHKGIEKESLRVTPDGNIAQTAHPTGLGSALTNPHITTDYSEALLELITPPLTGATQSRSFLSRIHRFVHSKLDNELLWATSMPCLIEGESSIPIARYGNSNVGTMKHVYRRGLEHRYGRSMQAIAGVHFNYSLPEGFWPVFKELENDDRELQMFISNNYFRLIRNFQRMGWLIPYLFGASPAVCRPFFNNGPGRLTEFDPFTFYGPYATSLRVSDIGYTNNAQKDLIVSYNNLESYVRGLTTAIETPSPEYERIGLVVDGEYMQLNTNVLQIENEFYSFVRPKQIARSGEKPTLALKRRGVRYVEIRALDVDPFDPSGVNEHQIRFMEAFLVFCLLQSSPPISPDEQHEINDNQQKVACHGRDPALRLRRSGSEVPLQNWAREICNEMLPIAELLDDGESEPCYTRSLEAQLPVASDPEQTPSARVLREMGERGESFFRYALGKSLEHSSHYANRALPPDQAAVFETEAWESLARQEEIEAADELSFEEFLAGYFAQS